MPPSKIGEVFVVELLMSPDVAAMVMHCAMIQTANPDDPRLPYQCRVLPRVRKYWNQIPTARLTINPQGWRPVYGGINFQLILPPQYDIAHMRAVAIYKEQDTNRIILDNFMKRRKGAMTLQEVNGGWYAHIRFRDGTPSKRDRGLTRLRTSRVSTGGEG